MHPPHVLLHFFFFFFGYPLHFFSLHVLVLSAHGGELGEVGATTASAPSSRKSLQRRVCRGGKVFEKRRQGGFSRARVFAGV